MSEEVKVEEKNEKKKKSILALLIKRNKIGFFVLLFFSLTANVMAWFIYSQIVSSSISARVKAWDIALDGTKDGTIEFTLEDLYPGMTTHSETVELSNNGDLDAYVVFKIHSITVMGETYTVESGTFFEDPDGLKTYIDSTYPFQIIYSAESDIINGSGGTMPLNFSVSWAYESGDDDKDTYWGEKAYEFSQDHPDEDMLVIVLDVNVIQIS